jgi:hypothetical protein
MKERTRTIILSALLAASLALLWVATHSWGQLTF